jgi:hypothetical protein
MLLKGAELAVHGIAIFDCTMVGEAHAVSIYTTLVAVAHGEWTSKNLFADVFTMSKLALFFDTVSQSAILDERVNTVPEAVIIAHAVDHTINALSVDINLNASADVPTDIGVPNDGVLPENVAATAFGQPDAESVYPTSILSVPIFTHEKGHEPVLAPPVNTDTVVAVSVLPTTVHVNIVPVFAPFV